MANEVENKVTKACKLCGSTIPSGVTRCPQCHGDLRNWLVRHSVISTILGLILISVIFSANSTGSKQGTVKSDNGTEVPKLEITDVSTKATETNAVWWKYAWVVKIKNNSTQDQVVSLEVKWFDAEGFILDTDDEYAVSLPAGEETTISGYDLLDVEVAPKVETVEAEIK